MISFSTVKFCCLSASVSLMAVFPRYTDRCRVLVASLNKKQTQVCKITYPYESYCHYENCSRGNDALCFFSPVNEAVCGSQNPARCDEGAATEETGALMKDSSNPRVGLYGCEWTTHNFICPSLSPLTTCQFCRDTQDKSVSDNEGNHKMTLRRKCVLIIKLPVSTAGEGFTVGVEPA